MITYVTGDLFESPAQTLVNTVNTVGVMGKGVALQFKHYFPDMFLEYQKLCEEGQLDIGTLHVYQTPHKQVLNFPTKKHWRKPSDLRYIELGLETFVRNYRDIGVTSVAFPPLGCGNGELSWDDVRPLMERYLSELPIPVYLYPPQPRSAVAEHRTPSEMSAWLREQPRSLPFDEVWRDLVAHIGPDGREFRTTTKQTPFFVEVATEDAHEVLRIRAAHKTSLFPKKELVRLWVDLRAHGYATSGPLDAREASYIFPILAALPYVKLVQLAEDFEKFSFTKALAIQLVPAPRPLEPAQHALPFAG
jgi:O-acetyl-ADP-ribose deacetylase (regulator of RNase III)